MGRNGHPFGPGASPLKISCIEPLRYWSIEYDGVGQRVTRQELMADIIQDAPVEPIRFHLLFEAAGPVYGRSQDMPEGRSVGNFHTEQIMKMRGHFHHRGKVFTVKGYGARDHSAGPRDYGPVIGDIWFQSQYENGDCLMVQIVRFTEAEVRSSYYYRADSGKLEIVEVLEHPFVDSKDQPPGSISRDPLADESIRNFEIKCRPAKWRSTAREGPTGTQPRHYLHVADGGAEWHSMRWPRRHPDGGMSGKGDAERHARLRAAGARVADPDVETQSRAKGRVSAPGRPERNQASARS